MDLPRLVGKADQMTGHAIDHDDRFVRWPTPDVADCCSNATPPIRNLGKQRLEDC